MTDHFREAEQHLETARGTSNEARVAKACGMAQAHAVLALATALAGLVPKAGQAAPATGPMTMYRAANEWVTLGHYTTREAARAHCQLHARDKYAAPALAWAACPPDEQDEAAKQDMANVFLSDPGDDVPESTWYEVTPLAVLTEVDKEADE
ncbi:hypothetical protein ACFUJR_27890 [Streptomyces sp. NPDC057271]|uniref:hypothetical protein n=1 Tax=unclassified Streptomyces TaxID=2593676 RepID=UPI0036396AA8